jgi:hypothetical protein
MINMTLKLHHINICNKIAMFLGYLMSFGLFDYDCTHYAIQPLFHYVTTMAFLELKYINSFKH